MNLGYHLGGLGDAWCIEAEVGGRRVPLAFSKEQALEIARRITAHYVPPVAHKVAVRAAERRSGVAEKHRNET